MEGLNKYYVMKPTKRYDRINFQVSLFDIIKQQFIIIYWATGMNKCKLLNKDVGL